MTSRPSAQRVKQLWEPCEARRRWPFWPTTVIATASVAPAYSIAATLVFVIGVVGLQAPAVTVLAFVPMLLTSIGYSELNKAAFFKSRP